MATVQGIRENSPPAHLRLDFASSRESSFAKSNQTAR